jgi:hypothetical protein
MTFLSFKNRGFQRSHAARRTSSGFCHVGDLKRLRELTETCSKNCSVLLSFIKDTNKWAIYRKMAAINGPCHLKICFLKRKRPVLMRTLSPKVMASERSFFVLKRRFFDVKVTWPITPALIRVLLLYMYSPWIPDLIYTRPSSDLLRDSNWS